MHLFVIWSGLIGIAIGATATWVAMHLHKRSPAKRPVQPKTAAQPVKPKAHGATLKKQCEELREALPRAIMGHPETGSQLAKPIWSEVARLCYPTLKHSDTRRYGSLTSLTELRDRSSKLVRALAAWETAIKRVPIDSIELAEACLKLCKARYELADSDFYTILGAEAVDGAISTMLGEWPIKRCIDEAKTHLNKVVDITHNPRRQRLIAELRYAS